MKTIEIDGRMEAVWRCRALVSFVPVVPWRERDFAGSLSGNFADGGGVALLDRWAGG